MIVDELPDVYYRSRDGKLTSVRDLWGEIDEVRRDIAKKMQRRRTGDLSVQEYLEGAKLPPDLRKMFINFVEDYHAAHLDQISARPLAAGDEEAHWQSRNKQFRILSGYDEVMHWLRAGLDPERVQVRLNTIAAKLRWKRGSAVLECRNSSGAALEPFHAGAAGKPCSK